MGSKRLLVLFRIVLLYNMPYPPNRRVSWDYMLQLKVCLFTIFIYTITNKHISWCYFVNSDKFSNI